jgi:hypothetical protein
MAPPPPVVSITSTRELDIISDLLGTADAFSSSICDQEELDTLISGVEIGSKQPAIQRDPTIQLQLAENPHGQECNRK